MLIKDITLVYKSRSKRMEQLNNMMENLLIRAKQPTPREFIQRMNHDETSSTFVFEVEQLNQIYDYYLNYYKPHYKGSDTARAFKIMRQTMRDDISMIASNTMRNTLELYERFFNIILQYVKNDWNLIKSMKETLKIYKQSLDPNYNRRMPTDFELVQYMTEMNQFEQGGYFYDLLENN